MNSVIYHVLSISDKYLTLFSYESNSVDPNAAHIPPECSSDTAYFHQVLWGFNLEQYYFFIMKLYFRSIQQKLTRILGMLHWLRKAWWNVLELWFIPRGCWPLETAKCVRQPFTPACQTWFSIAGREFRAVMWVSVGRFYTTFMVTTEITRLPNLGLAQAITITEISVWVTYSHFPVSHFRSWKFYNHTRLVFLLT